ncbi:hypothetical protein NO2_1179 [Candidatus Termititenax persephonae]|uniref:ParB/Sulfiredoxin domain-containing protein n=1 Tax=Candidatus Termititenax persephonae TaxID=2218525 RepID=A0A388THN4_9BACT|nr:hypothetical protein NO2_1179 [Candidatus Termititenax persephonae]
MNTIKYKEMDVNINDLILDSNNPRFAQLYSGNSQENIIQYLLEEEDAKDLAKRIIKRGFRQDKKLWVLKKGNKYLVKDGNRRCAAVKALQEPKKYSLSQSINRKTLPVIIYEDEQFLDDLIKEEHTSSSVREWSTIAKALEVYRLSKNNVDETELKSIDSDPARLLRIANFYNEAVKIGGDNLKELLRSSGKKGGKLIIFERLFQSNKLCGYKFGGKKANYALIIEDQNLFENYIKAVVKYLQHNSSTTHHAVDKANQQTTFLEKLGIATKESSQPTTTNPSASKPTTTQESNSPISTYKANTTAVKNRTSNLFPNLNIMRTIPVSLRNVLSEGQRICFDHNAGYPNASMALLRMVFESTLNLILKETKYSGTALEKKNELSPNAKLSSKKTNFAPMIKDKTIKTRMHQLDLEVANNIVHGTWTPTNKETIEYALRVEELINWLLKEKADFESDLDLTKL